MSSFAKCISLDIEYTGAQYTLVLSLLRESSSAAREYSWVNKEHYIAEPRHRARWACYSNID